MNFHILKFGYIYQTLKIGPDLLYIRRNDNACTLRLSLTMKRKSISPPLLPENRKRAAVPRNMDYSASMFDDPDQHEDTFVETLQESMSCYVNAEIQKLLKNVYSTEPGPNFCFLCAAFTFCYQITDTSLEISNMAFGQTVGHELILALLQVFLAVCSTYSDKKILWLEIKDPIPRVHDTFASLCLYFEDDGSLHLEPHLIRQAWERVAEDRPDCSNVAVERLEFEANEHAVLAFEKQTKEYHQKRRELYELQKGGHKLNDAEISVKRDAVSRLRPVSPDLHGGWLPEMSDEETNAFIESCMFISDDYVTSLECFLYQLYVFVKGWSMGRYNDQMALKCDSVYVTLQSFPGIITLNTISVRACLCGNKIATMVVWRLMSACCEFNVPCFGVVEAYSNAVNLLDKLGNFELTPEMHTITLEHMQCKTLDACGLNEELAENTEHPGYYTVQSLPDASFLNDQRAVEDAVHKNILSRRYKMRCD
jgi:hypothetical protein